jgi:hypothetical protein
LPEPQRFLSKMRKRQRLASLALSRWQSRRGGSRVLGISSADFPGSHRASRPPSFPPASSPGFHRLLCPSVSPQASSPLPGRCFLRLFRWPTFPLRGAASSGPSGGSGLSRCASGSLLPPASSGQPSRLSPGAASFGVSPSTDFRAFVVYQSWLYRWPTFPAFTGCRVLWLIPGFTYDLLLVHQLERTLEIGHLCMQLQILWIMWIAGNAA